VARRPDLQADLTEHLEDNFGELLPHVLLADVMRRTVELYEAGDVDRARAILDDRFEAGDPAMQELISTGFVETLPYAGERGHAMRTLLGPELQAEAQRVAGP
jgi:hypothetical protein